jgi:integral membrane protein
MSQQHKAKIGRLRILSLVEGLSLVLLVFFAVPMKYMFDSPIFVRVIGMTHGVLFLALGFMTIMVGIELGWKFKRMAMILVASVIPFGCFYVDKKLFARVMNEQAE